MLTRNAELKFIYAKKHSEPMLAEHLKID